MKAYLILKSFDQEALDRAIEGAPGEFQVLPFGTVEIEGEADAFVDEEAMDSIIAEFERRGNDMVIDYEHQTLTGDEAPAAGWLRKFVKKGSEGLWAVVEWTEKAKEYLTKKEYRYFSPVFWMRKADRKIIQIENIALTNFPKINNLHPIMAKMNSDYNNHKKDPAHGEREQKEEMMLEKLKKLFKLAADADEAKVVEAVEAVVAKNKELEKAGKDKKTEVVAAKEILEALKLDEGAKKEDVLKAIDGLEASHVAAGDLSKQVAKLTSDIAEIKKEDIVTLAVDEGKITPAQLEAWGNKMALTDPEQFKTVVLSKAVGSEMPVRKNIPPGPKDKDIIEEAQQSINKMMGIDEEAWKKYGPKERHNA